MATTTYITPQALSVAAVQNRTDLAGTPVVDVSGEELRLFASLVSPGVLGGETGWQTVAGTGMQVIVGSGVAFDDLIVVPSTNARQGSYLVRLDQPTVTVTLPAADLAASTTHELYVVVSDNPYDASGLAAPRGVVLRAGTPGAGAPGPATGWTAYAKIATITVGAGSGVPSVVDDRPISSIAAGSPPVGSVILWAGSSTAVPDNWVLYNGQELSRHNYARLFTVLGTTYGNGNGSTTFNVPDLRQRFPTGTPAGSSRGDIGGSWSHDHSIADATGDTGSTGLADVNTKTAGAHEHTIGGSGALSSGNPLDGAGAAGGGGTAGAGHHHNTGTHNHGMGTAGGHQHELAGPTAHKHTLGEHQHGGETGNANPPYMYLHYIGRAR